MHPGKWFDGHLDLTYLALHGRDLAKPPAECGGTLQPATVTFPTLRAAGVRSVISTLFMRKRTAEVDGAFCYDNLEQAHLGALQQIAMHETWHKEGWLEPIHQPVPSSQKIADPLGFALAIEGAACLRHADDLDLFRDAGVRMISLAWAEGSHWAGGDQSGGDITPQGRQLVARIDQLKIRHDVSHLSEQAFWTLLEIASPENVIVASHSNCRALLPGAKFPERHLSNAQIRALAARRGKIGINLFARFLISAAELNSRRATVADVLKHIAHVEQIAGRRGILALGSDVDSGFGSELLPQDLQGPAELFRLADALSKAGWSDKEIDNFAWGWQSIIED